MAAVISIHEEQYPAEPGTQCVMVVIPEGDEHRRLLAALLAIPTRLTSYVNPESVGADGMAALWDDAYTMTDWEGCP